MNTNKDALLVLDGNLIMKNQIIDFKLLTIDYVLLLYIPHFLDTKTYESTSIITNAYNETAPYTGKSGKDKNRGNYRSISHGYGSHGGPKVCGNVGQYCVQFESNSKQYAWRDMGDLIASNIWKHVDKFGDSIKDFFANQFEELHCIAIGLPNKLANVHSMHISKNSQILPHLDVGDLTWLQLLHGSHLAL
jgi:hypothetical protein